MKKQYLFLILVIYLIGCIMNLCYYIVIYSICNRLLLNILQVISQKYGLNL